MVQPMSRQEEDSEIGGPQVVHEKEQERGHQDVPASSQNHTFPANQTRDQMEQKKFKKGKDLLIGEETGVPPMAAGRFN